MTFLWPSRKQGKMPRQLKTPKNSKKTEEKLDGMEDKVPGSGKKLDYA